MNELENITVEDSKGFKYEVKLEHKPHWGFSTAYYMGGIIGQVELNRLLRPMGDDDHEWEQYEERFSEWTDEIKTNMVIICKNHFDSN